MKIYIYIYRFHFHVSTQLPFDFHEWWHCLAQIRFPRAAKAHEISFYFVRLNNDCNLNRPPAIFPPQKNENNGKSREVSAEFPFRREQLRFARTEGRASPSALRLQSVQSPKKRHPWPICSGGIFHGSRRVISVWVVAGFIARSYAPVNGVSVMVSDGCFVLFGAENIFLLNSARPVFVGCNFRVFFHGQKVWRF